MSFELKTRSVEDLGYPVAAGVLRAIRILTEKYGATGYRDSGHTKTAPTWVFELHHQGGAEVGVRMNRRDLTLYMRDRTLDGRRLRDQLPSDKISKVYPRDGKPAASIAGSAFLKPSASNELLLLDLQPEDVERVLAASFARPAPLDEPSREEQSTTSPPAPPTAARTRSVLNADEFAALLERRSEIGQAGELVAVLHEIERLRRLHCPDPDNWVERVALTDVGRGYDIASRWPGYERYIEVKTTTRAESDFYMTENERRVLASLRSKAYLYRVVVAVDGSGVVQDEWRDPLKLFDKDSMTPVVWRVTPPGPSPQPE